MLEEVDISVHCDIKIFDWLMCWIKYDNPKVKPDPGLVFLRVGSRSVFYRAGPEYSR